MIDHTLLAPEAGIEKIRELCADAKKYRFASVCVNPVYVRLSASDIAPTGQSGSQVPQFTHCDLLILYAISVLLL